MSVRLRIGMILRRRKGRVKSGANVVFLVRCRVSAPGISGLRFM